MGIGSRHQVEVFSASATPRTSAPRHASTSRTCSHPSSSPPTAAGTGLRLLQGASSTMGHTLAGSLAHTPPQHGIEVVELIRSFSVEQGLLALPSGVFGYDISNFQCASPSSNQVMSKMPTVSAISIIEVAGLARRRQQSMPRIQNRVGGEGRSGERHAVQPLSIHEFPRYECAGTGVLRQWSPAPGRARRECPR